MKIDFRVLDVRGVDTKTIKSYNNNDKDYGILSGGGFAHAIYFSNDFSSLKGNQTEINKLCHKFSKHPVYTSGFINAYLGKDRVNGESYSNGVSQSIIGARNSRSLKEFEYFGNNIENNFMYKFEKSAKDTYNKNEFESLSTFDQDNLNDDYRIAQTNRSHFCTKAKSFV